MPGYTRGKTAGKITRYEYSFPTSSLPMCALGFLRLKVTQTYSTRELLFLETHYYC